MSNDNGGPAFPVNTENKHEAGACFPHEGMTLRDYFAAKAMQGMITGTHMWADHEDEDLARSAYDFADAMIAERNKAE